MTRSLTFWAQALDNTSPDHIELRGEALGADKTARRQEAVSLVSRVAKAGSRIFDRQSVQLTVDDNCFVVEVPSVERDEAGRTAPIICYGECGPHDSDVLGESVVEGIGEFAERIGRTLRPEHCELVRESFAELKKKKSSASAALRRVGLGLLASTLLALIWFAFSRKS